LLMPFVVVSHHGCWAVLLVAVSRCANLWLFPGLLHQQSSWPLIKFHWFRRHFAERQPNSHNTNIAVPLDVSVPHCSPTLLVVHRVALPAPCCRQASYAFTPVQGCTAGTCRFTNCMTTSPLASGATHLPAYSLRSA
jgi:hypothetical protein